jgi:hypothetical protein
MIPFIRWQTPLGRGLPYLCLIPADIAVAATVFLLIGRVSGGVAEARFRRPARNLFGKEECGKKCWQNIVVHAAPFI